MRTGPAAMRRALAAFTALLLTSGALALLAPGTARADSAPLTPSPATPVTVAADALPTVQIDGVAWAQVVVGSTVYVGGKFTTARPAGAPAGTQMTPRSNLLAYDIRTGALVTSFAPVLNGQVLAVAASPDGRRLYLGGDFTTADGQFRHRVAAYDLTTGRLVTGFHPNVSSQVRAIAATNDTVYLGGSITGVGSVSRTKLAAVSAADGSLLPWAPVPGPGSTAGNRAPGKTAAQQAALDYDVQALVVTAGGQVVAGGRFDTMNGVRNTGVSALDPVTGAVRPFAVNQLITNQGINSGVLSLWTDGGTVVLTAYDFYGPGNLEGSAAVTADGGTIIAVNDCRGDTYSSYATAGVLYVSSHEHDCSDIGGFPEQNPRVNRFATAFTTAPVGVVGTNGVGDKAFTGKPAAAQLPWFPSLTAGSVTGQNQAGWSVTGDGTYLAYGGEFTAVNGTPQQGLVRFAVPSVAPDKVGPTPAKGLTPVVSAPEPGIARISWTTTSDPDNENLTYRVYRDGGATPVATRTVASLWWRTPSVTVVDAGVPAGTHSYRITVTDPFGNRIGGGSATSVDVPAGTYADRAYADTVRADGASGYWPLDEGTIGTAYDQGGASDLAVGTGVTAGRTGALTGDPDTAYAFDGRSGLAAQQTAAAAPTTFTEEAWFATTSRQGGKLMGWGNAASGLSSSYDRHVYLDGAGRVLFGVYTGAAQVLSSGTGFNDGRWHHVVAELSPAGMALYLDGAPVAGRTDVTTAQAYSGYFRVGGDRSWTGGTWFSGAVDEVALYPAALPADGVAAHYTLGRTGKAVNLPPTAAVTTSVRKGTVTVTGTASADPDGTIASYAWDLGDGTTATGPTVTHTYAAAGTYRIVLTVTDDDGATGTATASVGVVPNAVPTASFTATVAERTVTVDGSASADPDGRVTRLAWDFGDGTTATGPAAAHTYAADGSYPVTLTVTDDDGATATTSRTVAVAAPVVLAADSFDRTVATGLGTAGVGGAWTASNGSTRQSVSPGAATLRLDAAGNQTGSSLASNGQTDTDTTATVALTAAPTGGGTTVWVTGRRVGTNLEYRARLRFLATGQVGVALSELTGTSTEVLIGREVLLPGYTYTAGAALTVRLRVTGSGTTSLAATVWAAGTDAPVTPTVTGTDTTAALQAPGGTALSCYLSGSATAPLAVRVSGLRVLLAR